MEDNPYAKIAEGRGGSARPKFSIGIVKSAAPLVVQSGGLALTGADLYVNGALLGYSEQATLIRPTGTLNATSNCTEGSITKLKISDGTLSTGIFHGASLAKDDMVALLTEDDQTYAVLCKVVKMA